MITKKNLKNRICNLHLKNCQKISLELVIGNFENSQTERLNHPPDPTRIQMMIKASNIFIASC